MSTMSMPHPIPLAQAPADPLAAVTHPDPYPYYRELALRHPFHRDAGLALWVAAGPAEVDAVLRHPACRVRPVAQPVPPPLAGTEAGALYGAWVRMNDGVLHAALRGPLQQALAAVDLPSAFLAARHFAGRLGRGADGVDGVALANAAMFAVPVLTVACLLGLTAADGPPAFALAADIAAFSRAMSPMADAATIQAGIASARRCAGVVTDHAQSPWCRALRARAGSAGVEREVVTANLIGLMIQSCEATAGLIGNTLLALARGVAEGPPSLPAVIARVLHDDPPIHNTRRFVAEDTRVCGVPLRHGDGILVLLAAAAVACADHGGASPTFGAGPHRCPGAALAAVIAEAAVAAMLERGLNPGRLATRYRYRSSLNARIPEFL